MITAIQWKRSDDEVLKNGTVALILRESEHLKIWSFLFLHYKTSIYSKSLTKKFNSVIRFSTFGFWKHIVKIPLIHWKNNIRLKVFKKQRLLWTKKNTIKTDKHATNVSSATIDKPQMKVRHSDSRTSKNIGSNEV